MSVLLFGGDEFYPLGGWADFLGEWESLTTAVVSARAQGRDWWHIADAKTGEILAKGGTRGWANDRRPYEEIAIPGKVLVA